MKPAVFGPDALCRALSDTKGGGMSGQAEIACTPRTEARLSENGDILCTCGKTLAKSDEEGIEWKCRCGQIVYLPNEALFLRNCTKALDTVHHIVTLMAQRRSVPQ